MGLFKNRITYSFIQWLKDRSIKNKLMLSISICAISMLVIGFTSLKDLNVIQKDLSNISQFYLKSILYLLELDKDLNQGLLSERNMMLTKNNPEQFKIFLEKYNKDLKSDIEKRWEKGFLTLKEDWNEEEQRLINEYEKERDEWLKFSDMIVKSLQEKNQKDFDDLIQLTLTEGFEKFTKMRESINHLTKIYTEQSELKDIESQETYRESTILQIAIISVSLLFSVVFGLLIVNIISKPVKMVVENLKVISDGDVDRKIHIIRKDEIGELANAFNEMQSRLLKSRDKLKHAQKEIYHAEKLASIGRLAAGVAHEINNPLMGLKNCAQSIYAEPQNIDQTKNYVELMKEGLEKIESIVQKLLDFAHKKSHSHDEIDLKNSLERVLQLVEYRLEKNNIKILSNYDPDLNPIFADSQLLEEVFMNILINSVDAMPRGGKIIIETHNVDDNNVQVKIEDNGIGISEDHIDNIFDPFFTTKAIGKGTGLGLSVSLTIIEELGGKIMVESEIDKGSSFDIIIPKGEKKEL